MNSGKDKKYKKFLLINSGKSYQKPNDASISCKIFCDCGGVPYLWEVIDLNLNLIVLRYQISKSGFDFPINFNLNHEDFLKEERTFNTL